MHLLGASRFTPLVPYPWHAPLERVGFPPDPVLDMLFGDREGRAPAFAEHRWVVHLRGLGLHGALGRPRASRPRPPSPPKAAPTYGGNHRASPLKPAKGGRLNKTGHIDLPGVCRTAASRAGRRQAHLAELGTRRATAERNGSVTNQRRIKFLQRRACSLYWL